MNLQKLNYMSNCHITSKIIYSFLKYLSTIAYKFAT